VLARVGPALSRLSGEYAGRDIVAVAHGGSIRAALATALSLDPEAALSFSVDTWSLTRIDHIADAGRDGAAAWRIVSVNLPAAETFE
jgi:alpha-ribazole phosphatase